MLFRSDRIVWGASFGMCMGYCRHELQVTATEIRLTDSSWDPEHYPARISTRPMTREGWDSLTSALDASGFRSLHQTYGCPDCADGGAEWVEAGDRRVTFEYGSSPAALQPLVLQLRTIHATVSP